LEHKPGADLERRGLLLQVLSYRPLFSVGVWKAGKGCKAQVSSFQQREKQTWEWCRVGYSRNRSNSFVSCVEKKLRGDCVS